MNYEGEGFSSESSNLQAQIDALNVRLTAAEAKIVTLTTNVTTLQGQMTTALAAIAALQSGIFSGRVLQFTSHHTPFMIDYFTDQVTISNHMDQYEFLTPDTVQIKPYYANGATFYFHSSGTLNGSPLSLSFALSQNDFTTPLGGVSCPVTAAAGTPNYYSVHAYLQVTDYTPSAANFRFVIWVCLNGSVVESVCASGIPFDPTAFDPIWLGKIDTTPGTTVTRMQGFVQVIQ